MRQVMENDAFGFMLGEFVGMAIMSGVTALSWD